MRPLLVGEGPSPRARHRQRAFHVRSRSARFLCALLGLERIRDAFRPMNLLASTRKDPRGKGCLLDPRAAFLASALIPLRSPAGKAQRAILCGRRVARAFGLPGNSAFLAWRRHRGGIVAVIPHPSPVNRWWNDPANLAAARAFLLSAITPPDRRAPLVWKRGA